jgi:glucose/arabinose dehydrogenase
VRLDPFLSGLNQPVFIGNAHDGSNRLFVVERPGVIRVVQNGQLLPDPFLDITQLVESGGQEQGLLGLAFHPDFAHNGIFFVDYTAKGDGEPDTVARYHVSADPNRADPASAVTLIAQPDIAANHNGGMLAFGPDGYLYIALGDGGVGGSPNGQKLDTLFGKILRLDVDHGDPYAIPPTNPYVNDPNAKPETWAYGLRNPWRFSFDRATGDLWIGDVGETKYEEIDLQPAGDKGGENYGWATMEGLHCYQPSSGCDQSGLTLPISEYTHDDGCAVVGGYVYRGVADPSLTGVYFFGDDCSGNLWSLQRDAQGTWQQHLELQTDLAISSFGEDEAGELYVTDLQGGAVYRLRAAQP